MNFQSSNPLSKSVHITPIATVHAPSGDCGTHAWARLDIGGEFICRRDQSSGANPLLGFSQQVITSDLGFAGVNPRLLVEERPEFYGREEDYFMFNSDECVRCSLSHCSSYGCGSDEPELCAHSEERDDPCIL